jgi:hypothetical protein
MRRTGIGLCGRGFQLVDDEVAQPLAAADKSLVAELGYRSVQRPDLMEMINLRRASINFATDSFGAPSEIGCIIRCRRLVTCV